MQSIAQILESLLNEMDKHHSKPLTAPYKQRKHPMKAGEPDSVPRPIRVALGNAIKKALRVVKKNPDVHIVSTTDISYLYDDIKDGVIYVNDLTWAQGIADDLERDYASPATAGVLRRAVKAVMPYARGGYK